MTLFSDGSTNTENNNSSNVRIAVLAIIVLTITITAFSGAAAADTLTVSENETIQEVVDDASDGDTVVISDGEYQEEVTVDTDITLSGEEDTVLDGNDESLGTAISIESGSVTIEDLTIQQYGDNAVSYNPPSVADEMVLSVRDVVFADNDDVFELDADNVDADAEIIDVEARSNDDVVDVNSVFGELAIRSSSFTSNDAGVVGNPTELVVDGTTIQRGSDYGVDVTGAETVSITDSSIIDNDEHNIRLADLPTESEVTIDSVDASDGGDAGIVVEYAETVILSDVTARSNSDEGIEVDADSVTITSVTATGNGDEALVIDAETSEITDVDASDSGSSGWSGDDVIYIQGSETEITDVEITPSDGETGIYTDGVTSVDISDVEIEESADSNIRIETDSSNENITIRDSTLNDAESDDGISIDTSSSSTINISGIDAVGNDDRGIAVEGGDVTIDNVDVRQSGDQALDIDADTSEITDVDASDSGSSGWDGSAAIYIQGSETELTTIEVTPSEGDHGIHTDGLRSVSIENADVSESADSNIYLEASSGSEDISIQDSSATQSDSRTGIHIDASGSTDIEISDTTTDGNSDSGFEVSDGGTLTVDNLQTSDNGDEGIEVNSIDGVSLSEVTATGNSGTGILIEELSDDGSITDSTIVGNDEYEIRNDADRRIDVSDSTVGLFGDVENDDHNYITGNIVLQSGVSTENPDQTSGVSAGFTIDPRPAQEDATVTFDASSTQVLGSDATYEWDLTGDGDIDQTGELVDESFEEGTYDVTLTVEDSEGREDEATESFEVGPSGINTQITTTRTELTTDEQTAIEFSVTNFLTSERSDVQMIVENPSGLEISSTHNVDQSSNQVTLTETVSPTEQQDFRFTVSPTSPGTYEVTAIAEYESEDGTDGSRIEETAVFEVTEPSDTDSSESDSEQDDDSGSSFWGWVRNLIILYIIYKFIRWIAA